MIGGLSEGCGLLKKSSKKMGTPFCQGLDWALIQLLTRVLLLRHKKAF